MIHFEYMFVRGVRSVFDLFIYFLHVVVQLFRHHLLKRLSFLHCVAFAPLPKISWPYVSGSTSLFHSLTYFPFCYSHHTVLATVALSHLGTLDSASALPVGFILNSEIIKKKHKTAETGAPKRPVSSRREKTRRQSTA